MIGVSVISFEILTLGIVDATVAKKCNGSGSEIGGVTSGAGILLDATRDELLSCVGSTASGTLKSRRIKENSPVSSFTSLRKLHDGT